MSSVPDLQLHKANPTSYWLAERVGAVLLFLFVLLGLGGIFGAGPFSKVEVSGDGIVMTYPRFARNHSSVEIKLQLRAPANGCIIDRAILDEMMIESIMPAPERQISLGSGDTKLEFSHEGGDKTLHVTLYVKSREWGIIEGRVMLDDDVALPIKMIVFP